MYHRMDSLDLRQSRDTGEIERSPAEQDSLNATQLFELETNFLAAGGDGFGAKRRGPGVFANASLPIMGARLSIQGEGLARVGNV